MAPAARRLPSEDSDTEWPKMAVVLAPNGLSKACCVQPSAPFAKTYTAPVEGAPSSLLAPMASVCALLEKATAVPKPSPGLGLGALSVVRKLQPVPIRA